jgi:hypothetical protein
LLIQSRFGDFVSIPFTIDSGADFTSIPIPFAQRVGIAFPRTEASRGSSGGLLGLAEHYKGSLRVRVGREEFDWPCLFLQVPAPPQARPPAVLGRTGFLNDFSFCLDDDYLTIERRPKTWWAPLWRVFWPLFTPLHPPRKPL